ncbi:MAG TPA: hypothetical protein VFT74_05105, partial [Isosphaeraceae bacterium]|nr:hypothetical protein [Isosphaeraceae bacterium]
WQGRFKAFPCQDDDHVVTLLRYVERNALRASLVSRAEDWPYGSLHTATGHSSPIELTPGPLARNAAWINRVNKPLSDAELDALRHCVARGTPFGAENWVSKTATSLGLESSVRPRGRPRKTASA